MALVLGSEPSVRFSVATRGPSVVREPPKASLHRPLPLRSTKTSSAPSTMTVEDTSSSPQTMATPTLDQLISAITDPKMIDTEFISSLRSFSVERVPLRNMKLDWPGFSQLCDDCMVLCEVEKVAFEYDGSTGIVSLTVRPEGALHCACRSALDRWIGTIADDARQQGKGSFYPETNQGIDLEEKYKIPDCALFATDTDFPTIAIEIGVSEPLEQLFESARHYLQESRGTIQAVILVKFYEKNRGRLQRPPWGLSATEMRDKRADKSLVRFVRDWHKERNVAVVGDLEMHLYLWSAERKNPPPHPIWKWRFGPSVPDTQGIFVSGMRNPLLDKDFNLKILGGTYPLPVAYIKMRMRDTLDKEERSRVAQFVRDHKQVLDEICK